VSVSPSMPDTSGYAQAGQHLGRAVQAGITSLERQDQAMSRTAAALQLNRMGLENELLAAQIGRIQANQMGPPMPGYGQSSPGGGNTGDVINHPATGAHIMKPNEITTSIPGNQAHTAGPAMSQNQWAVGPNGSLQPFPPKDLKVEDEFGAPLMARWLATQSYYRPPEAVWRQAFPGATGVRWDTLSLGWVPTYDRNQFVRSDRSMNPYRVGRHGDFVRSGRTVTVPMPR